MSTLPARPFLACDHKGRLVSTIYVVPLKALNDHMIFDNLAAPVDKVDYVDMNFNAGHLGAEEPHYHIVLWHISKSDEARLAK